MLSSKLTVQAANQKNARAQMDGEERERAELEAQIARAKAKEGEKEEVDQNLQKKEGEKITLSLQPLSAPSAQTSEAGPSSTSALPDSDNKPAITFGTIGTKPAAPTSIAINPLKRPAPTNVFKAAKSVKTEASSDAGSSKKSYTSEAERLMKEDQARKAMRTGGGGGGGYQGAGPRRMGDGPRRFVLQ
jgi:DNA/RNA-binding protein KIN17